MSIAQSRGLPLFLTQGNTPRRPLQDGSPPFAQRIHSGGRYFLDQNNNPIFLVGDSPWSMMSDWSTTIMDTYMATRASQGFNAFLVSLVATAPNNGGVDDEGTTTDAISPWSDLATLTPNETYWARVDTMFDLAQRYGMTVLAYPVDAFDFLAHLATAGTSNCEAFGRFIGNRYKARPNVMWAVGGDYTPSQATTYDTYFAAVQDGIQSTGDAHPWTIQLFAGVWPGGGDSSWDSAFWAPRVDFDFVYSYNEAVPGSILDSYQHTWGEAPTTRPTMMMEATYESGNGVETGWTSWGPPLYHAITLGGKGAWYGSHGVWTGGEEFVQEGSIRAGAFRRLISSLTGWQDLVPATGTDLVTSARGSDMEQLTCAVTPNKKLALIYCPDANAFDLDSNDVGSNPTMRRIDPTDASSTGISFATSITPPATNSGGHPDWLYVIEAT